ncbi:MAG: hypothetical protein UV53_C0006G0026 [Candidatus Azambacteria bacterium GW2011_GWE1_42_9]|nr:MAG: hypothetical protein UU33_C0001G0025 [Candidatus Azambacteria bacterium GW2011_GWF1_41_10]KKS49202.1 MAG: hypothetical protein UV14_C0002G0199 [Candidatus Azambacteria bacterium GW2011_GWF2_42_22]KKS74584.1 MAG: hypothetical protein UV45_C0001G0021 [Candidatus Azambacteria bacterium GW2011_GWB1_42_72]KKS79483.1 MAG: hypothetical protein UV53_C0006G0026 [Candidatus Azambacteria bacterium GW2011_GWE1_42_9]KKT03090.1 MAG: hypothetical protein UV81_C0004G0027 [Candidatus Azambacteria bacter
MRTPEEIDYELLDKCLISEDARAPLSRALSYLPNVVIDFVIENCVFISPGKDDRGIYIATGDFRLKQKQCLIILPNMLWSKNRKTIAFVVAHEVAHAYKKHGFKSFEDSDLVLNGKRERDADKQAILWLRPHFTGSFKECMYKSWQLS